MSPCRVAILQSNYLPWKGYFQIADGVDVFVFYDDVQYTKNDWRNRNVVKTAAGPAWITVPVLHGGRAGQRICDAEIDPRVPWQKSHRRTVQQAYAKAPHLEEALEILGDTWTRPWKRLSEMNQFTIRRISEAVGIRAQFRDSTEFAALPGRTERLVGICRELGATQYHTGPSAASYLDLGAMRDAGIEVQWVEYRHREYPQLHPPFEHRVSIVDVLANLGASCLEAIRSAPMPDPPAGSES